MSSDIMASETEEENPHSSPTPQESEPQESSNEHELTLEELLYSSASYHAIVKPVSLTMILSALAVVFINTDETIREGEEALASAYQTFDNRDPSQSTAETLGYSLLNALIIVCILCAMTFLIVLLYKYRCMMCLIGYMVFSFSALLGLMGGFMLDVAVNKYNLDLDMFSFYFCLYNFAIVGSISIFYQQGIPAFVTQGYLIATSVILAWQLSHFDDWTSWTLLIMLALYDLCAVLTPCGPLKALVNLMSQDDAPNMPGLLYEAELPAVARRPGARRRRREQQQQTSQQSQATNETGAAGDDTPASAEGTSPTRQTPEPAAAEEASSLPSSSSPDRQLSQQPSHLSTGVTAASSNTSSTGIRMTGSGDTVDSSESAASVAATPVASTEPGSAPTGPVPFAIAKIYRLPLVHDEPPRRPSFELEPLLEGQEQLSPNDQLALQYTSEQLRSEVEASFPPGGGRIDRVEVGRGRRTSIRYHVKDRQGVTKRVLFVDEQGRVMQETDESDDDHGHMENSIKLGLGDFIFYSVLVSKAAQYSFTTFVSCMLAILSGLGGTLVLLAVYQQALPALPISIFLGVIFYLLTRALIEPWIEHLFLVPYFV